MRTGWVERRLGDCAVRVVRRVDPATVPGMAYVGLGQVGTGTLGLLGTLLASEVSNPVLQVEPGEIVFGALRPYFRKLFRAPFPLVCTPEAWVLRPETDVDAGFLFYLLASEPLIAACSRGAEGTRMPRARWEQMAEFPVGLPPLGEQRRIARTLAVFDEKIQLNREEGETLGALTGALFRRLLGRGAVSQGCMPSGWRLGSLADLAENVRETVLPEAVPPETPCVGLEHVPRRAVALDAWGLAAEATSEKVRFGEGDLLFGRLRPGFHKVVPAPLAGIASPDILVVRPKDLAWRWFLFGHLFSDALVAHATKVSDGTKMPRASWEDLCHYSLLIPPVADVQAFTATVDPLYRRIAANVRASRTLARLRDVLLGRLLGR